VLAFGIAACGNGVPGNSVARVDDALIKKSTFDHWMGIAAASSQPPGSTSKPTPPDAPKFTNCIAQLRKTAPKPGKGQPRVTDAQFKSQCKQQYDSLRDQVLQFLISAEWIQGEAKDQGVKVSDAEVKKEFEKQRKQSFPKPADFQRFLKTSGQTMDDLLFHVKLNTLSNKIREKVTKGKNKVTDKQIAAYYAKNKQRFSQPEKRDLLVVLTKTKAKAAQARSAIQGGQSFASVAKKFSIDQASKSLGGKLPAVTRGQQERALDNAVFRAPRGALEGPVKTQFGYYVFKVTRITAATQQSLATATPTIRQILGSQGQSKALDTFVKKFQKKWKGRTNCRKGFIIQSCKNAPKPKKSATAPPGAVPQQGGAQQVPQQGGAQQVPQQGGAQPVPQQAPPSGTP
jgi:foldase protein PrsA